MHFPVKSGSSYCPRPMTGPIVGMVRVGMPIKNMSLVPTPHTLLIVKWDH